MKAALNNRTRQTEKQADADATSLDRTSLPTQYVSALDFELYETDLPP